MDYNSLLIEILKQKKYITFLKKDILDTYNELKKSEKCLAELDR